MVAVSFKLLHYHNYEPGRVHMNRRMARMYSVSNVQQESRAVHNSAPEYTLIVFCLCMYIFEYRKKVMSV